MEISDRNAGIIKKIGTALFIVGTALLAWALNRFDSLPNYLRLAAFVPFAFAVPMVTVENYRSDWPTLDPLARGRAIAWLFLPFFFPIAVLVWYLVDPAAKA